MNDSLKSFLVPSDLTLKQAMRFMSANGQKEIFVVDGVQKLLGALSDGDIRKWIIKGGNLQASVKRVCNRHPKYVGEDFLLQDVKDMMLTFKIEAVPVIGRDALVKAILIWDDVFAGKVSRQKEQIDVPIVIMAGGKGTRLDPFTKILPKPLIPIGDKPVIELIMDKFYEYGIRHFYISVNHKAWMIKSYFQEIDSRYKIDYIEEDEPLGTAGSLKFLQGKILKTFVVTNCDVMIDSDYGELVRFHEKNRNDLTLVVSCRHYVIPYGVCEIERGGMLKKIKEKPEYDLLVNTGMYVMSPKVFGIIPKNRLFNMTDLISKAKSRKYRVGVFPINEKHWIDVGQLDEYQKALKEFGL